MANQDVNDIIDIFGINLSSDDEQSVDIDIGNNTIKSEDKDSYASDSFQDKLKEAQDKMTDSKTDVKSLIDISIIKAEETKTQQIDVKELEKNPLKITGEVEKLKQTFKEQIAEPIIAEESDILKKPKNEIENDKIIDDEVIEKAKVYPVHFNEDTTWTFTHSNPKFEQFYEYKKSIIANCLFNGELQFPNLLKEFNEHNNDVSAELYDLPELYRKMDKIVQSKTRVLYIGTQVHIQYFLFERGIELLRGVLSKFEHVKPVQKQDGVIYEHMSDVEFYFAKLKAFHKIIEGVLSNLDSAYNCLNRKVTSSMPMQDPTRKGTEVRYVVNNSEEKPPISKPVMIKNAGENPDGYDPLPENMTASNITAPINIPVKKEIKTTEGTKEINW
jgi:hypothetical protein